MATEDVAADPVGPLADEFMERCRRGERASVTEYAARHPELADRIRQVFSMIVLMEKAGSQDADGSADDGPATGEEPAKPERIGGYRILREIGRGGMGVVYEAEQTALGRHVALKVLPIGAARKRERLERFHREARAAARLHHTNIVPVFEVGTAGDLCYYAMQFIHGQPLDLVLEELRSLPPNGRPPAVTPHSSAEAAQRQAVARSLVTGQASTQTQAASPDGPATNLDFTVRPSLEPGGVPAPSPSTMTLTGPRSAPTGRTARAHYYRSVASVGIQAAEALAYAHQEGVIHRDIKPSNLLLDTAGRVWVTDFGLAYQPDPEVRGGASLTQTGEIVGTIRYMPPERFRGWSDPRSDVYSLGLTLYEMLLLRPAFDAPEQVALMEMAIHEEPTRLRQVDRQIPRDLETIVLKAIDKEPARRYQSAAELAGDLKRFLEDRPILARPSTAVERTWRWCKRNRVVAGMGATVALLVLVVMVGATIAAAVFRRQRDDLADQAQQLQQDKSLLSEAAVQTETSLWKSNYAQAQAFRWSGLGGRRFRALQALSEAARLKPQLDPADWHSLLGRPLEPGEADRLSHVLLLRNEVTATLALSDLRVVQQWQGLSRPDIEEPVDFSPDLDAYARAEADGSICIRRVADDGIAIRIPAVGKSVCRPIRFSPNGRWLAVKQGTDRGTEFFLWDLTDRATELKPVLRGPTRHDAESIDFSPDDRWLAVDAPDGSIGIYDVNKGTELKRLRPTPLPWFVRFDPRGERLAASGLESRSVQIWDVKTGKVVRELGHPKPVAEVAWSHDGRCLAVAGMYRDQVVHVWDAESGVKLAALEGHKAAVWKVAFHPHADLLISHGWDNTRLWDFRRGRELLAVDGWFLRFSRDGRHLAFRKERQVGLWKVTTAAECRPLSGHDRSEHVYSSAFTPDGRLLISARDGIRLWDAATGRQVAALTELGQTDVVAFDPASGGLFTCTRGGLFLWPVRASEDGATVRYRVGPPEPIPLPVRGAPRGLALSRDGNVLAVALDSGPAAVVHRREEKHFVLNAHNSQAGVAVSPDGRWVATGNYKGSGIHVWDSRTGQRTHEFSAGGTAAMNFSPDGQWLVISEAGEARFYRVGTWEPRLPGEWPSGQGHCLAFTRDGQVMAVGHPTSGIVRLVRAGSGRELATLEITPSPAHRTGWPTISPDASQLVIHYGQEGVWLWDLRKVRERLAEMGLDWDAPSYPPAGPGTGPIQVEVDLGAFAGRVHRERSLGHLKAGRWQPALDEANRAIDLFANDVAAWNLRAEARLGLKEYEQALDDYRHSRTLGSPDALADNNLAWRLVVAPGAGSGLVAQAIEWARAATELAPQEGTYWNTLGVAHYRAGDWDEAIRALNTSLRLQGGGDHYAHDAFFMAMAHWKQGDVVRGRDWLSKAREWMQKHSPDDAELRGFDAEARACAREALRHELERLTRMVERDPTDPSGYLQRALVHRDLGQYEQARDDFDKVLALNPEHVYAYHHRGHVHEWLKQFDRARDDFDAALKRKPDVAHFHDMRGLAHYRLRDYPQAARDWERSLALAPKQPLVCADLAWLYATGPENVRDAKKALPLAERAVELEPDGYEPLKTLGAVQYRLDQYADAVVTLTRAGAATKAGPTAYDQFFLAMSYHRLGETSRARECYERAIAWRQKQTRLLDVNSELLTSLQAEAADVLGP